MSEDENWRAIPGYKHYEVSDHGRVKSLARRAKINCGGTRLVRERILKQVLSQGYPMVGIRNEGKVKSIRVHQLVAVTFLNHTPCGHDLVVDHIDNNPFNNHVSNLQVVTQRINTSKDKKGGSSQCPGVCFHKGMWHTSVTANRKQHFIGNFKEEDDAINAYNEFIEELPASLDSLLEKKAEQKKWHGVYIRNKRYRALWRNKDKLINIGTFNTREEARLARIQFIQDYESSRKEIEPRKTEQKAVNHMEDLI